MRRESALWRMCTSQGTAAGPHVAGPHRVLAASDHCRRPTEFHQRLAWRGVLCLLASTVPVRSLRVSETRIKNIGYIGYVTASDQDALTPAYTASVTSTSGPWVTPRPPCDPPSLESRLGLIPGTGVCLGLIFHNCSCFYAKRSTCCFSAYLSPQIKDSRLLSVIRALADSSNETPATRRLRCAAPL